MMNQFHKYQGKARAGTSAEIERGDYVYTPRVPGFTGHNNKGKVFRIEGDIAFVQIGGKKPLPFKLSDLKLWLKIHPTSYRS